MSMDPRRLHWHVQVRRLHGRSESSSVPRPRIPTKSSKYGSFGHPELLSTRLQHLQATKLATVRTEPVKFAKQEKSGQAPKMVQRIQKKSADKKKATEAKSTAETKAMETKRAQDAKNSADKVTERKQGEPKKSTDTTKPQETTKSADAKKPVETEKEDTKKAAATTKVVDVVSSPGGAKKPAETTKQVEAKRPGEATQPIELDDMAAETSRVQKPADTGETFLV
ncbi:hypothetical protein NM688_g7894 [Phlebia brevispora]|uniref:Uncharacterized protein n=1 Tax=Phlebia brevispora TaxID=194682 RepID=A0ACC1RZW2_9APHY|nr:hypothetical protein NM688_g7894 [Phlebia brevispora]